MGNQDLYLPTYLVPVMGCASFADRNGISSGTSRVRGMQMLGECLNRSAPTVDSVFCCFGKLAPFTTVGELVEAVTFVPRQIDFAQQAGEAESQCVVVDHVLSKGELFQTFVARSPTADIEIGGVPVRCVLDTGADTSLIPASFYHDHLTVMVKGLQSVGIFIKIVGVNDMDVLIEGYLYVPISIL